MIWVGRGSRGLEMDIPGSVTSAVAKRRLTSLPDWYTFNAPLALGRLLGTKKVRTYFAVHSILHLKSSSFGRSEERH